MRVDVGPVEPTSARAWIGWAREMLGTLRREPAATPTLPADVLDDVGSYVDSWAGAATKGDGTFRWQTELHPEELEYLANSLYNFDRRLADKARPCPGRAEPSEGRAFHVVLVECLLFALAQAGASQAAFAEQLRPSWPVRDVERKTAPPLEPHSGGTSRGVHFKRTAASAWDAVRPRLRCARPRA